MKTESKTRTEEKRRENDEVKKSASKIDKDARISNTHRHNIIEFILKQENRFNYLTMYLILNTMATSSFLKHL